MLLPARRSPKWGSPTDASDPLSSADDADLLSDDEDPLHVRRPESVDSSSSCRSLLSSLLTWRWTGWMLLWMLLMIMAANQFSARHTATTTPAYQRPLERQQTQDNSAADTDAPVPPRVMSACIPAPVLPVPCSPPSPPVCPACSSYPSCPAPADPERAKRVAETKAFEVSHQAMSPEEVQQRVQRMEEAVAKAAAQHTQATVATLNAGGEATFACRWRFQSYVPSEWEKEWVQIVHKPDFMEGNSQRRWVCPLLSETPSMLRAVLSLSRAVDAMRDATTGDPRAYNLVSHSSSSSSKSDGGDVKLGSVEWMRTASEPLFSRMRYDLYCSAGPSEPSAGNAIDAFGFVLAEGDQLIEPLVGLLRDPLSICDMPEAELPPHFKPFYDRHHVQWGQSREFFLFGHAAPWGITMRKEGAVGLPTWVDAGVLDRVHVAVASSSQACGHAPWLQRTDSPESQLRFQHPTDPQGFNFRPQRSTFLVRQTVPATGTFNERIKAMLDPATPTLPQHSEQDDHSSIYIHTKSGAVSLPSPAWSSRFVSPGSRRYSPVSPRVFLFDLGCSSFSGWSKSPDALGTAHFYDFFQRRGWSIDQVFAWEYAELDAELQWRQIPAELSPFFQFVNRGVTAAERDASNHPWNHLLAHVRPLDYVIVKLDIDNTPIEAGLMLQLMDSPVLLSLIDEMFFEHHTMVHEMGGVKWGANGEYQLTDSYDWFTKIRQAGMRMHSWP